MAKASPPVSINREKEGGDDFVQSWGNIPEPMQSPGCQDADDALLRWGKTKEVMWTLH